MKLAEAAEKLHIAKGTLRKMCCQGNLPPGVKAKKVPVFYTHQNKKDSGRSGRRVTEYRPFRSDGTRIRYKAKQWDIKLNSGA